MKITYSSRKLEKLLNSSENIKKRDSKNYKKIEQRMFELRAADTLADIPKSPPPRCHELKGNKKGQLSVDLVHPMRLILKPGNIPTPQKADGGLDWGGVTEIIIIGIEDTH